MAGGRIVQLDSPSGLYNAPQSLYAAEFIGETNLFRGRVTAAGPAGTEVETLGRRLMLPPSSAPVGAEVTLALRPERLRRNATADGPEARLHEVDFIGTDQRLVYALADGTRIVLRQQNCGGPIPAPGEVTRLAFDPADIRLFQN